MRPPPREEGRIIITKYTRRPVQYTTTEMAGENCMQLLFTEKKEKSQQVQLCRMYERNTLIVTSPEI